jgi:hypothetical protein
VGNDRFLFLNDDGDFEEEENGLFVNVIAVVDLGGGRIVTIFDDVANYADNINNFDGQLGITCHASSMGDPIKIKIFGSITDPAWSFNAGVIFLSNNGLMTQIQPIIGASVIIGKAKNANSIFIKPEIPIVR